VRNIDWLVILEADGVDKLSVRLLMAFQRVIFPALQMA
jgi:hypothetical protein